ncbi:MAG: energy transducer TonB [Candidatus Acidiferrales bacterium]
MRPYVIRGVIAFLICAGTSGLSQGQEIPSSAPASHPPDAALAHRQVVLRPLQLIHQVTPAYPPEAVSKRIEGNVLLNAVIGSNGSIKALQCVGGPAELRDAAMEAVRQWQYTPFQLNGTPMEIHFEIGILFSLTKNDYEAVAGSNYPVSLEVFASSAEVPPPNHPAPDRKGASSIPDAIEGIQAQTAEVFDAWSKRDQRRFEELLNGFALEDPTAWLTATFGPQNSPALVRAYEISLEKFKRHMTHVAEYSKDLTDLHVESSIVPSPPEEAGQLDGPPVPIEPVKIENFRFFVVTGPGDWVFSFVYANGAFHIVGGTHTFWNEDWRRKQAAQITSMTMVPASVN